MKWLTRLLFGQRGLSNTLRLAGSGAFSYEIVGESHYQAALDAICGGKVPEGHWHSATATIRKDPNNQHSERAIRVEISGNVVGYISRDRTDAMHKAFEQFGNPESFTCNARIAGGWDDRAIAREAPEYYEGRKLVGCFGVKLDIARRPFRLAT